MMIRLYEFRDREAVRHIFCETADKGNAMERFFHDREIFADMWMNYYTDYEPESLWVAEQNGAVVGYLTGCLNDPRFTRIMILRIIPRMVLKALFRGTLFHYRTWRLLLANFRLRLLKRAANHVSLEHHPGHLHMNLREEFRGQKIGPALLEHFFEQAKKAGISGIHAGVREDNQKARHFFERAGFRPLGSHLAFRIPLENGLEEDHHVITYGKRL